MTVFELLSCLALGVAAGYSLTTLARWGSVGIPRALALSSLGGLVGGLVGASISSSGPLWGNTPYHPVAAAFAIVGGVGTVALLRFFVARAALPGRRPSREP
jgi:hypothetical protein